MCFSLRNSFEYKESVNIKFVPTQLKPTNSLVLRGKYTILTLAVFAEVLDENSLRIEEAREDLVEAVNNQKENNNHNVQLDNETDTLHSTVSCKTENITNFERLNGKECDREIKLIEDSPVSISKSNREIQPISSPTNDMPIDYVDAFDSDKPPPHSLEPINDSESISSIEEIKNENRLPQMIDDQTTTVIVNATDSDLEPISPEPDQPVIEPVADQFDEQANKMECKNDNDDDDQQAGHETLVNGQQPADLLYISSLTEKVSDDEMGDDFNPDFEANEHSLNQRLESRTSTNSEDLEAISSEEEYFDDVAGANCDNEIFVDYSEDEIQSQMNYENFKNEFNPAEYVCRPLKSLDDPSLTVYENTRIRNFQPNHQLVQDIINFDRQDKDSQWIEFIENLELNSLDLHGDEQLARILIGWAKIGIDFELAFRQKITAFKVRHLKAGLKLLGALVQTTDRIVSQLLDERILETIYKLFFKPYMTFPIKLLLIRTLDLFTDSPTVIEHVLNHRYELDSDFSSELRHNLRSCLESCSKSGDQPDDDNLSNSLNDLRANLDSVFASQEKTIYQLLLILMVKTKETRMNVGLTVLLKKIHFYEFLLTFKQAAQQPQQISDTLADDLNEITSSFKHSKQLFGQRLRYLPAKIQFEVKPCLSNVTYAIYKWLKHLKFLDSIVQLCTATDNDRLINSILGFLNEILLEQQGTAFLLGSEVYESTNRLFEVTNGESTVHLNDQQQEQLVSNDKLGAFKTNLKYNLYILELIDQINEAQSSDLFTRQNDESQLCLLYNKLYSVIFSEIGARCLVKQLCDSLNLAILIRCLAFSKGKGESSRSKFVCFQYAVQLVVYTIKYSKERLCELFIKFHDEFVSLPGYTATLSKWLSPLKRGIKFNYDESTFKLLVSNLKQHSERLKDLKENCTYRVSPDLICCVHVLHHLCIEPNRAATGDSLLPDRELKFKYGLIQLFTQKGITYILTIIERLAEIFLKPSHLNSSLIGNQGYFLTTLFRPCIALLKQTLLNLTHCRGSDFKDTLPIRPLLKVYSLMLVFPLQSPCHLDSVQICNEVITILHSYTELSVNINEVEDEVFVKSIWTKMVKEVIQFTTSKPFNFSHGLYLLSQLLPLPLSVRPDDDPNEIARRLNFRKLWSAHIHVLFSDVESMLQKLVLCLSPLIQCLLRRVCYQLIDLSSHAGVIVSKCLLSVLDQHLAAEPKDNLTSVFDLIAFLLRYNLFKHAFTCTVNTLNSSIKKDERLDKTIRKAIELLKSNQQLLSSYSSILAVLETKPELASSTGENELDLTQMEKLNLHYNNREENIQLENLDDLTGGQTNPAKKLTQYDLVAFSKKYLDPNFDVRSQLMLLYKNEEPNYEEKLASKHKHEPLIAKDSSNSKRPYVAPLRGRGFQRNSNQMGRHDPFRSRPPNTSRPPSMHVDEFESIHLGSQNSMPRQKQDFNKFNQGQRANLRSVYNYNYRQPNARMNNLNNRPFNRYGNIQTNYSNNGLNNSNNPNKMRKQQN